MSKSRGFRSRVVAFLQVGGVAVALAVAAARIGETDAAAVGAAGSSTANAGTGGINFSDDFESPGTWVFWSSSSSGIGYVSSRPADALSPTHVGDEYDRHGAAPTYQLFSRSFTLPANAGPCSVAVYVKPLTTVTGELQILDPASKTLLASTPFTYGAGSGWIRVNAGASVAASTGQIAVRVVLDHNGTFQEFLVDNLMGNCVVRP